MINEKAWQASNFYRSDLGKVLAYFSTARRGLYEVDMYFDLGMGSRRKWEVTVQYLHRIKAIDSDHDFIHDDKGMTVKKRVWLNRAGRRKLKQYSHERDGKIAEIIEQAMPRCFVPLDDDVYPDKILQSCRAQ